MAQSPTLPFEDSSFNLIYAVGVFSQVYDDWHHWAVEIRRVLKPGGVFFMSYAGQVPFEEMLSIPYDGFAAHPGLYVKNPFNSWNRGGPMVFMSPQWLERHWGSLFDIDFVAPDALLDYQSICVMRKPARGTPPRPHMRVIEVATRQAFNPDATGRIYGRHDTLKPFVESYGIEAKDTAPVEGWIALRGEVPERLEVIIDGIAVESTHPTFDPGLPYRDWMDTQQTTFRTRIETSALPFGHYQLTTRIIGQRGAVHEMSIALNIRR